MIKIVLFDVEKFIFIVWFKVCNGIVIYVILINIYVMICVVIKVRVWSVFGLNCKNCYYMRLV